MSERCPYCHDGFAPGARRVCGRFAAPHHPACWDENRRRCATCGAWHSASPRVLVRARARERRRDPWEVGLRRVGSALALSVGSALVHRALAPSRDPAPVVVHVSVVQPPPSVPQPAPRDSRRRALVSPAPLRAPPAPPPTQELSAPQTRAEVALTRLPEVPQTELRAPSATPSLPPKPHVQALALETSNEAEPPPSAAPLPRFGPTRARYLPPASRPLQLAYCAEHATRPDPLRDLRLIRAAPTAEVSDWEAAAEAGEGGAIRELGLVLASRRTAAADRQARVHLEQAAAHGDRSAQRSLGALLLAGHERSPREGADWLRRAARDGDRDAGRLLTAALLAYPRLRVPGDPR